MGVDYQHHYLIVNMSGKRDEPETPVEAPPAKVAKTDKPAYTFNMNKALDKAHETKSFKQILELPPSALQGLAERADAKFAKMHIKTIADLGNWKFYKIAKAVAALADTEEENARNAEGESNLNSALDKAWETKTFAEMMKAPLSALQGLAEWVDDELEDLRPAPKTVEDLANWKYCRWSEAFITLAEYENADHSSR